MAKKMFKQTNLTKYEDLGDAGSWNPLFTLKKAQDSLTSCYIDKVRISFILEGDTSGLDDNNLGYLFVVTNKETLSGTDLDNKNYIVSSSASRGGGGVVTLDVKRRIVDNTFDEDSGNHCLGVQCRMTDTGITDYAITLVAEVWGRWHRIDNA